MPARSRVRWPHDKTPSSSRPSEARAGTHTPCHLVLAGWQTASLITGAADYGSRLALAVLAWPGRRAELFSFLSHLPPSSFFWLAFVLGARRRVGPPPMPLSPNRSAPPGRQ